MFMIMLVHSSLINADIIFGLNLLVNVKISNN